MIVVTIAVTAAVIVYLFTALVRPGGSDETGPFSPTVSLTLAAQH